MTARLEPPFAYFGGKRKIAAEVWRRFGDVDTYIEPFCGSAAVLLARPPWHKGAREILNDIDGYVVNFWRAVKHAPEEVARYADEPIFELDKRAKEGWLIREYGSLVERLQADPEWYDAKAAGWWVWGKSVSIGTEWCKGGRVSMSQPHLRRGGILTRTSHAVDRLRALADRLRGCFVLCGDWQRAVNSMVTAPGEGTTGVFLDPPYGDVKQRDNVYRHDDLTVAEYVRQWAIEHGSKPHMRIALCGEVGEHDMPDGWQPYYWSNHGGWATQNRRDPTRHRRHEVVWFSPHCVAQLELHLCAQEELE